ncbi:hypothetical protein CRUP_011407 [Coryphaenoides rupestris]|nr:hypothetical protein CRUP_011407 [Coryphaenoides rupestris]
MTWGQGRRAGQFRKVIRQPAAKAGPLRRSAVKAGPLWRSVVKAGPIWMLVVKAGPLWRSVVKAGPIWRSAGKRSHWGHHRLRSSSSQSGFGNWCGCQKHRGRC